MLLAVEAVRTFLHNTVTAQIRVVQKTEQVIVEKVKALLQQLAE
jgi:hypothetical protein